MKTAISAILAMALASMSGHSALADDAAERIAIGTWTFSGKGCASPGDVSVALSADGKWLEVAFPTSFSAASGENAVHTRVACNGVISVDVPTGYAVGLSKDALQGVVFIPASSDEASNYAQVTSEFFFASQGRGQKLKQRFETPGETRFSVDATSETIWSSCGGASSAALRVNTALIAHGNASAIGFSAASADENALRLAVSYRKCASADVSDNEEDVETEDADDEQASAV